VSESPLLRVVTSNGEEILDAAATIRNLQDELAGAHRDVRTWRLRYAELARDKEREAQEHKLWPVAIELFLYWKDVTNHPRAEWTASRFWDVLPYLKKYGQLRCKGAIAGCAFDHYSVTQRNGRVKHFDEWERIFSTAGRFEDFLSRVPSHVQAVLDADEAKPTPKTPQQSLDL
jgi:hypothetical protein